MAIETLMSLAGGGPMPLPKRKAMGNSPFDAAGRGRRGLAWSPTRLGVNTLDYMYGDELLRRSRDAVRNSSWASTAVDSYAGNAIGTGIKLIPQHPSEKVRTAILREWNRWVKESDVEYESFNPASGQTDFYGQQVLAAREVMEAGEVFVRLRVRPVADRLRVPLQLQLIEAEQLPVWRIGDADVPAGNQVRSGIEFRPDGRREAYHFYKVHPGETLFFPMDGLQVERVPAKEVLHVYKPVRAGQFRGQPWFTSVLAKLYELDQYMDSEIVRKKTASMITGFIKQVTPDNPIVPPDQNATAALGSNPSDVGATIAKLEPGSFPVLNPGEDIVLSQALDSGDFVSFVRSCIQSFAVGCGCTYEQISGDLKGVNYSSIRAGILEFRRKCEQFQNAVFIFQFCQPVFRRWLQEAVIAGALILPGYFRDPGPYEDVRWETPGWPWVDPKNDLDASQAAIRNGLSTRSKEASERGLSAEQIDAEQAADKARADGLGLVYDCDPSKVLIGRETNPSVPGLTDPTGSDVEQEENSAEESGGESQDT